MHVARDEALRGVPRTDTVAAETYGLYTPEVTALREHPLRLVPAWTE